MANNIETHHIAWGWGKFWASFFKNRSSSLLMITKTIRGVAYLIQTAGELEGTQATLTLHLSYRNEGYHEFIKFLSFGYMA